MYLPKSEDFSMYMLSQCKTLDGLVSREHIFGAKFFTQNIEKNTLIGFKAIVFFIEPYSILILCKKLSLFACKNISRYSMKETKLSKLIHRIKFEAITLGAE